MGFEKVKYIDKQRYHPWWAWGTVGGYCGYCECFASIGTISGGPLPSEGVGHAVSCYIKGNGRRGNLGFECALWEGMEALPNIWEEYITCLWGKAFVGSGWWDRVSTGRWWWYRFESHPHSILMLTEIHDLLKNGTFMSLLTHISPLNLQAWTLDIFSWPMSKTIMLSLSCETQSYLWHLCSFSSQLCKHKPG